MASHDTAGYPFVWDEADFIRLEGEGVDFPGGVLDMDTGDAMTIYGGTVDPGFHHKVLKRT